MAQTNDSEWLVLIDVDAVQSWLFSSVRMREIAGGSQLLVDFDEGITTVAKSCEGELLSCMGGGTTLLKFRDIDKARKFTLAAKRAFREATITGRLSASEPMRVERGFRDAYDKVNRSLEINKRQGHDGGELLAASALVVCESCGAEAAVGERRDYWLGPACTQRFDGRQKSTWFFKHTKRGRTAPGARVHEILPLDFDTLAKAGTTQDGDEQARGKLAIVVADVNGVGDQLRQIADEGEYRAFSSNLRQMLDNVLEDALAPIIPDNRLVPVELLFAGGDDLVLACRGDLGLPLAERLATGFRECVTKRDKNGAAAARLGALSMTAAAVITGVGFPFRVAHEIALRLVHDAKREAKEKGWTEGMVDFHRVTEAFADARQVLADRTLASDNDKRVLHLTARPFRAIPSGARSVAGFRDACKLVVDDFPTNKLFSLRQKTSARMLWDQPAASERDVETVVARLQPDLAEWQQRVQRRPDAADQWRKVADKLAIGEDLLRIEKDNADEKQWRFAAGDLAEGLGLWGTI